MTTAAEAIDELEKRIATCEALIEMLNKWKNEYQMKIITINTIENT